MAPPWLLSSLCVTHDTFVAFVPFGEQVVIESLAIAGAAGWCTMAHQPWPQPCSQTRTQTPSRYLFGKYREYQAEDQKSAAAFYAAAGGYPAPAPAPRAPLPPQYAPAPRQQQPPRQLYYGQP